MSINNRIHNGFHCIHVKFPRPPSQTTFVSLLLQKKKMIHVSSIFRPLGFFSFLSWIGLAVWYYQNSSSLYIMPLSSSSRAIKDRRAIISSWSMSSNVSPSSQRNALSLVFFLLFDFWCVETEEEDREAADRLDLKENCFRSILDMLRRRSFDKKPPGRGV